MPAKNAECICGSPPLHLKNKMKIEETKKLKAELETKICDLMNEFTAKTGVELKGMELISEEKKEETVKVTDMTGDMTDTEFEQIVYEVYERMKDCMYLTGKQRIREILDKHRAELISMGSMDITYKFEYDGTYYSQILGRIRRKK